MGTILKTPKQGWEDVDILKAIKQALAEDIFFDGILISTGGYEI